MFEGSPVATAEHAAAIPRWVAAHTDAGAERFAALDDQVLVEVQIRRIEGRLSGSARRELIEANLALLEDFVAALRHRLDPGE